MNWNSKAVSEVAKERIWSEHVQNEASYRRINEKFRVNPIRLMSEMPVADSCNPRSQRFLNRESAMMQTLQARGLWPTSESPSLSGSAKQDSTRSSTKRMLPKIPLALQLHEDNGLSDGSASQKMSPALTDRAPQSCRSWQELNSPTHEMDYDDATILELLTTVQKPASQRYPKPMTTMHEIGWGAGRKVLPDLPMFQHPLKSCEITKFANAMHLDSQKKKATK